MRRVRRNCGAGLAVVVRAPAIPPGRLLDATACWRRRPSARRAGVRAPDGVPFIDSLRQCLQVSRIGQGDRSAAPVAPAGGPCRGRQSLAAADIAVGGVVRHCDGGRGGGQHRGRVARTLDPSGRAPLKRGVDSPVLPWAQASAAGARRHRESQEGRHVPATGAWGQCPSLSRVVGWGGGRPEDGPLQARGCGVPVPVAAARDGLRFAGGVSRRRPGQAGPDEIYLAG
jgi:hypothetical protein